MQIYEKKKLQNKSKKYNLEDSGIMQLKIAKISQTLETMSSQTHYTLSD